MLVVKRHVLADRPMGADRLVIVNAAEIADVIDARAWRGSRWGTLERIRSDELGAIDPADPRLSEIARSRYIPR